MEGREPATDRAARAARRRAGGSGAGDAAAIRGPATPPCAEGESPAGDDELAPRDAGNGTAGDGEADDDACAEGSGNGDGDCGNGAGKRAEGGAEGGVGSGGEGGGGGGGEEALRLDAALFALLDREIDSQWGKGGSRPPGRRDRDRDDAAPARSERIASGGGAGTGPLSEELKARSPTQPGAERPPAAAEP